MGCHCQLFYGDLTQSMTACPSSWVEPVKILSTATTTDWELVSVRLSLYIWDSYWPSCPSRVSARAKKFNADSGPLVRNWFLTPVPIISASSSWEIHLSSCSFLLSACQQLHPFQLQLSLHLNLWLGNFIVDSWQILCRQILDFIDSSKIRYH